MKIAIFNNYKFHLYNDPQPSGIRNIISYSDNIGNIVFLESIEAQTGAEPISIYDFTSNYKDYEEKFDIFILSLANMISESFRLADDFLSALESINKPICIFSIGIQVYNADDLISLEMNDTIKRVLNLSKKFNTTIGLRGYHTEEYLSKMGYNNTMVVGCPSIFLNKVVPNVRESFTPDRILISGSYDGNWREPLKNLFKFGYDNYAKYLIQSESKLLYDKFDIKESDLDDWFIDESRKSYLKNIMYDYNYYRHDTIDVDLLRNWFIQNSIYFSSFKDWLDNSKFDLSVGVRFHGSVMSTLAGTPTLILSGDLRVQELVDYHGLPSMDLFDFKSDMSKQDLYQMIDYIEFQNKYDSLLSRYVQFLKLNGIEYLNF